MLRLFSIAVASLVLAGITRGVDSTWNYAVEITATVQISPAQITLRWLQDTNGAPASYAIFRKPPGASDWGNALATLSGDTTSFTDATVAAGTLYEYQIVKDFNAERGYRGYGYIQTAINAPLEDVRGKIILIVDQTYAADLAAELLRLQRDLVGDGWQVIRHDVGRGDSVPSVKALIRADYEADPANVNTVFLFGHVPVPYSGLINPDGHASHRGAWPADVYYGDMDGTWTDVTVNSTLATDIDLADAMRIRNVPGDGKFDQSTVPGVVRLKVGRVDLANMPGFLQYESDASFPGEVDLLRRYLNKDHAFRQAQVAVPRRALMGDYIGNKGGAAEAASGFRSFPPLVGSDDASIVNLNVLHNDAQGFWVPELQNNAYLLALGCGAGSYTTISGIGTRLPYFDGSTTDLVLGDIRAVVVMMFGSWCGDWDHEDNIVRSVLATPTYGLLSMYVGVPHWFLHPMGLGETAGYCARLTQNNTANGPYRSQVNRDTQQVHIALMGDPTLRLQPVAPASALSGAVAGDQVKLSWSASPDGSVLGYHIYRATDATGPFTRLTASPIAQTSFTDAAPIANANYMVRAVKLEVTPSGSFFNASQGAFVGVTGSAPVAAPTTSRLINLSVRSHAGTGGQTLALGFVIGGGAGSMPMLVRASGPALQAFGASGVLPDPILTVYRGEVTVGSNDNWGANAAQVSVTGAAVGAFPLADSASKDAALVGSYSPAAYSAEVRDAGGSSGNALLEVYDATPIGASTAILPRLLNLSARTQVGPGAEALAVGFVVSGAAPIKVLVRGIGVGLEKVGSSRVDLQACKLEYSIVSPK